MKAKTKYNAFARDNSKPVARDRRNHLSTGATEDMTGYKVITKKPYKDVKNGIKSGLKTGGLSAEDKVKVINVQKFILINLPEPKLKELIEILYRIAVSEQSSEPARIRCCETLISYGIGLPTAKIQLEPRTEKFTVTHNVIHLDDRSQLDINGTEPIAGTKLESK